MNESIFSDQSLAPSGIAEQAIYAPASDVVPAGISTMMGFDNSNQVQIISPQNAIINRPSAPAIAPLSAGRSPVATPTGGDAQGAVPIARSPGQNPNQLFSDPNFRNLLRQDPVRAQAAYKNWTGQDFGSDQQAWLAEQEEQSKNRRMILNKMIPNLDTDPITGELQVTRQIKNPAAQMDASGNAPQMIDVKTPMNAVEKAAFDEEGGFKELFGIDQPSGIAVPKGLDATESAQFRQNVKAILQTTPGGYDNKGNPNPTALNVAISKAKTDAWAKQNPAVVGANPTKVDQLTGTIQAIGSAATNEFNILPKLLNAGIGVVNQTLGGSQSTDANQYPIPAVPLVPNSPPTPTAPQIATVQKPAAPPPALLSVDRLPWRQPGTYDKSRSQMPAGPTQATLSELMAGGQ